MHRPRLVHGGSFLGYNLRVGARNEAYTQKDMAERIVFCTSQG